MNIEEFEKYYAEDKSLEYKQRLLKELIEEKNIIKRKLREAVDNNMEKVEEFWEKQKKTQPSKEKADIYRWSVEMVDNTRDAFYSMLSYFKKRNELIEKLEEELETENKKITEYTKKE